MISRASNPVLGNAVAAWWLLHGAVQIRWRGTSTLLSSPATLVLHLAACTLGQEIVKQMYAFPDKKNRPVCLIPEVTGPVQELWRSRWAREAEPKRLFYVARCYRYERPQFARYREFTQIRVELLGASAPSDREEVVVLLRRLLDRFAVPYFFDDQVRRALGYYTESGFEARCDLLGAQQQIAGGGRYAEGVGWAVGLDRILAAETVARAG